MSQSSLAFLIGLVGFIAFIVAVVTIGDFFVHQHWLIQLVYYVTVGIVWVFPAKRLMIWGAGGTPRE
jgi:hypothetical protein